ncbi:hypothetical protein [Acinetobacter pittii]|uniref:hypothetical protein n=1 Tax=Acinetobacter pittii TaxID=48296 RepID=UPI00148AC48A|nr:hypothetical protein [Acinetobacter pittii]
MNILNRCSTQSGYSVAYRSGVIAQELDGGAPRFKRRLKNAYHTINVRWVVGEIGFQYLDAFYNVWCENPSQPFYANLKVNGPEYKPYECFFVPDSFQLTEVEGLFFTLTAQLRTRPIVDSSLNKIIVEIGNKSDLAKLVNPLEKLVNKDAPESMEGIIND